ncbi:MAG: hypothetical protein ACI9YO_003197 [Gammaproteobacteria bacterium]|jgi:hypothetical protein
MLERHENKEKTPSSRTALFAEPGSSDLNEVLDTGTALKTNFFILTKNLLL